MSGPTSASTTVALLGWDGNELAIVAPAASPPGARIEANVEGVGMLRVKVHRCRRRDDESFLVVGRVLDLRRADREVLESSGKTEVPRW